MERADVEAWLAAYIEAWRPYDREAIATLFSAQARYRFPPPHTTPAMTNDGIFYDKDADLGHLRGKTIAILGYGSQGHAHALNLKDSGCEVVVGLRADSASRVEAEEKGLRVVDVADAASEGDVVMILLPDERQAEVWE